MSIGHGFDVHAFGPGAFIMLGGVHIPHTQGLIAHSDGDVKNIDAGIFEPLKIGLFEGVGIRQPRRRTDFERFLKTIWFCPYVFAFLAAFLLCDSLNRLAPHLAFLGD